MAACILIVEDDADIVTLLQYTLEKKGFHVYIACSAEEGRDIIRQQLPDLVIVDWMLPQISGIQWVKELRQHERTQHLAIMMLTAKSLDEHKEEGLNEGADDYLTKPFSPRELIARIHALLRRTAPHKTKDEIHYEGLIFSPEERNLVFQNKSIVLDPSESKLLHFLITHPKKIYSRRQLLDWVWGDHVFIEERTVDVHIGRLRKALSELELEHWIETIRGSGYRFQESKK